MRDHKRFKPPKTEEIRHPDDGRLYTTEHTFTRPGAWGGDEIEVSFYHDDEGKLYLAIKEPDGNASTSLDWVAARRIAKLLLNYADKLAPKKGKP